MRMTAEDYDYYGRDEEDRAHDARAKRRRREDVRLYFSSSSSTTTTTSRSFSRSDDSSSTTAVKLLAAIEEKRLFDSKESVKDSLTGALYTGRRVDIIEVDGQAELRVNVPDFITGRTMMEHSHYRIDKATEVNLLQNRQSQPTVADFRPLAKTTKEPQEEPSVVSKKTIAATFAGTNTSTTELDEYGRDDVGLLADVAEDGEGDVLTLTSTPISSALFLECLPYVAAWIKAHRTALAALTDGMRSKRESDMVERCFWGFYNWRWHEPHFSDTSSDRYSEPSDTDSDGQPGQGVVGWTYSALYGTAADVNTNEMNVLDDRFRMLQNNEELLDAVSFNFCDYRTRVSCALVSTFSVESSAVLGTYGLAAYSRAMICEVLGGHARIPLMDDNEDHLATRLVTDCRPSYGHLKSDGKVPDDWHTALWIAALRGDVSAERGGVSMAASRLLDQALP
jgi:hypothetical protein